MAEEPSALTEGSSYTASSIPEKKYRPHIYWTRPKSHLYEYNYDYSSYYYRPQIEYMNRRNHGYHPELPQPQTWAERALHSYLDRAKRDFEIYPYTKDIQLLNRIRWSTYQYYIHTKLLARRLTGYNPDALVYF